MDHRNIKDIAKDVRGALKKEFPAYKFSVKIERYSMGQSLNVDIMESPIELLTEKGHGFSSSENYLQVNQYHIDNSEMITEEAKAVIKRICEISNKENWDKSDIQTDYFDVNYYFHLNIGKWDQPLKVAA